MGFMQGMGDFFEVGSLGHDISFCREAQGGGLRRPSRGLLKKFPEPKTARFNVRGNYRKDVALTHEGRSPVQGMMRISRCD